ncbi:Uncharacterised protein [Salmonella enterica subsp. enterica]|uniref:Uncharacterized protein n=1 Tax=Salmonella enterica I TaxID=59201 RepID=A0A3S5DDM5_SALET|nr:Uncharacterised protein [Salmonella enterica subsp. enterica]
MLRMSAKVAGNGGSGGHRRANQVSATPAALTAFKVTGLLVDAQRSPRGSGGHYSWPGTWNSLVSAIQILLR